MVANFVQHFSYHHSELPYNIELSPGLYIIEAWGGSGGTVLNSDSSIKCRGGSGGYSIAKILFHSTTSLIIYAGGEGQPGSNLLVFNGGGPGYIGTESGTFSSSGGGASDVRMNSTIESRLIVSGGGGGVGSYAMSCYEGGNSGGFNGFDGKSYSGFDINGKGGTNYSGGSGGYILHTSLGSVYAGNGTLGSGGFGVGIKYGGGGGGGGHYGGGGSYESGGGGGSSYICPFCEGYSLSGDQIMPQPNSAINSTGYFGPGHIRISLIPISSCSKYTMLPFLHDLIIFLLVSI